MLPLVDIFYNYNLTTCACGYLQFNRSWGLLMIAAFRKGPGENIAAWVSSKSMHTVQGFSAFPSAAL